jgi:predicted Zn-dependent peptidase
MKYLIKRYLSIVLLTLTGFLTAHAQADLWQTGHDGMYTFRYVKGDPMHARYYKLKNGLTVILSVNKKEPRIQTLIGVRAGSNNDPKDHTGLAHYLEHLLFKGTTAYGSLNWNEEKPYIDQIEGLYTQYNHTVEPAARKMVYHRIDSLSGIAAHFAIAGEYDKLMTIIGSQGTNAHTSVEETVYEEDIPSASLDQYLAIQAERYRDPVFRLFHTELEAVYEEKNSGLDNDARKVYAALLDGLFPATNYGLQTTIGTVEHLKNPSLTAIRKFYDTWYVPNNMAIVMAGDLDPAVVIRKIDQSFDYMKPQSLNEYNPPKETPIKTAVTKDIYGPDAESVNIAYRMPGVKDQHAQVMLEILADLLSNGKAGLIDLDLNQAQKLQSARAYNNTFKQYGMLVMNGKARPGQSLEEVKKLLLTEVKKIRSGDFDQSLVMAIVNNAKLAQLKSMQQNDFRANTLMSEFIKDKGSYWPENVRFLDNMLQISKADIVAFANQYTGDNYVLIYKHTGADNSVVKVDKPAITPVYINKEAKSAFLQKIEAMPKSPVQPQWLDYANAIEKTTFGNTGLLYVQNKDNSLFTLSYRFDMGSWNNKLLPFAADYLQFLSTDKATSSQLTRAFYNIACSYDINVGTDQTVITISGLQENFKQAIKLFENVVYHCQPDESILRDYKARLIKARENNKLSKSAIMRGLIEFAQYGMVNPYNYQLSNEALKALTAGELTDLLHELLHYRHSINYYGPATIKQLENDELKAHELQTNFTPIPTGKTFIKTTQEANQVLFANYDMVQAEVYWVRNTDTYNSDETATISVFNNYFGGGMGSIVFQTIRESKALAYSTFAQYVQPNRKAERYLNIAYVGTQADKMKDAIAGMNELLNNLPDNPAQLDNSRQSIRQDIATERIQPDDYISRYIANQKLGLKEDERKKVYEAVNQISYGDLKQLHDDKLKNKPYVYCIVGSEEKIDDKELQNYGRVRKLTLEEIFGY